MSVQGPLGATQSGAFELRRPAFDERASSSRSRLGLTALSVLLVTGAVLSIAAAQTDQLLPDTVRPVPRWLAGPFGSSGLGLGTAALIVVLVAMFAAYVVAVRTAEGLSVRMVLMSIAALHALILLAPPLISTDVFSYQAYARMGDLYGLNPFLHGPHTIALDPLYPFIGAKWVNTPTVYGPIFTTLSYVIAPISIAASALAYKALAAISSLVMVTLVWKAARLRGVDPVRAIALVGLNPLVVVYGVGGGHNDLLMLALLVGGVLLLLQHRERMGAGTLALATGVKLTAGLLLPFALAGSGGRLSSSRRRDILVGAGSVAALTAAVAVVLFGGGPLHLPGTVQSVQSRGDWHSIPGFIGTRLGLGTVGHATGIVLAAIFALGTAWLLRRVWRRELDWIDGAAWATLLLLLTAGSMLPWYVAWLMPLAALAHDRRLVRASLVLSGVVVGIQLLGYIPHGSSLLGL